MNSGKQKLCIIGIGDAGIWPAHYMAGRGVDAIYMGIGNSGNRMGGVNIIEYDSPKREFIPGVTRFLVPDMTVEATIPRDVEALLKNDFHFLIFAGLGGYTGTKLTAVVVEKLIAAKSTFTCIVSYPFRFEGKNRSQNAKVFLKTYGKHPNVEVFHLDELCRNTNLLLSQAFTFATLKLVDIAKMKVGIDLEVVYPEVKVPGERSQKRSKALEALRDEINKW